MKELKIIISIILLLGLIITYGMRIWDFNLEKIILLIPVFLIYIVAPLLVILRINISKNK